MGSGSENNWRESATWDPGSPCFLRTLNLPPWETWEVARFKGAWKGWVQATVAW